MPTKTPRGVTISRHAERIGKLNWVPQRPQDANMIDRLIHLTAGLAVTITLFLFFTACTPINMEDPHNRIVVGSILGATVYRPTTYPQLNCYTTGAHAGVIATCY